MMKSLKTWTLCQSMGALGECLPWSTAEDVSSVEAMMCRVLSPVRKPVETYTEKVLGDYCALPVQNSPKLRGTRFLQQGFQRSRHVRSARCIGGCKGSAT